jgi:hypothetical protein
VNKNVFREGFGNEIDKNIIYGILFAKSARKSWALLQLDKNR